MPESIDFIFALSDISYQDNSILTNATDRQLLFMLGEALREVDSRNSLNNDTIMNSVERILYVDTNNDG